MEDTRIYISAEAMQQLKAYFEELQQDIDKQCDPTVSDTVEGVIEGLITVLVEQE